MVSDKGKAKRPQIPGTLPRSAPPPVKPGNTGKPSRATEPSRQSDEAPRRRTASPRPTGSTSRTQTRTGPTTKTRPRTTVAKPAKGPSQAEIAKKERRRRVTLRIIALIVGASILIAAGLFIKSKMDDHKQAIVAAEEETPDTIEPCLPSELTMSTTVTGTKVGQPTTFDIKVENTSEHACSLDIGKESLILTVTSGEDRIWQSNHCVVNAPSNLYVFGPGVGSTLKVNWDGKRSTADCQQGLNTPGAGQYVVTGTIGGQPFDQIRQVFTKDN